MTAQNQIPLPDIAVCIIRREQWKFLCYVITMVVLAVSLWIGTFLVVQYGTHPDKAIANGLVAASIGVLATITFPLGQGVQWLRIRHRLKALINKECLAHWTDPNGHSSWIGRYGGLIDGKFMEWNVYGHVLTSASIEPGQPSSLVLTVVKPSPFVVELTGRVIIPIGREAEAYRVIDELQKVLHSTIILRWLHVASIVVCLCIAVIIAVIQIVHRN